MRVAIKKFGVHYDLSFETPWTTSEVYEKEIKNKIAAIVIAFESNLRLFGCIIAEGGAITFQDDNKEPPSTP